MFTVTPAQLASIASVAKMACTVDKISPVLSYARITVDGDQLTIIGTDRYVAAVAEYTLKQPADEPVTVLIAADQLVAAAKTFTIGTGVTITRASIGDDVVTGVFLESENYPGQRFGGLEPKLNYPPVDRLLPTPDVELCDIPVGVGLNMATLGRLSTIRLEWDMTPAAAKMAPWQLFGTPQENPNRAKSSPILAKRGPVRVLIQPNLIRD